jgi:CHASE3 domain sensor protein
MQTLNRPGNKDNDIQYMSLGKRYLANFIFIPAMLIILVISIYSYHVINSVMISQTWIAHTYKVMQAVDQSLYGIADIETHHRGFLITGDNQFYIDKQANIKDLNEALKTLMLLTRDNAEQNIRSKHLADLIAIRLDMFEVIMNFKKDNKLHTPEVMKIFYSNLKVENEIEATGKEIISIELTLLNERENAFNENTYKTNLILIAGSVTSLIFIFIAFLISNIAIHRQILAEKNRAILALQLREVIESASDMIAAIDINQRFFIFNEWRIQKPSATR